MSDLPLIALAPFSAHRVNSGALVIAASSRRLRRMRSEKHQMMTGGATATNNHRPVAATEAARFLVGMWN
ncbi:hypothetical protein EHS39_04275 [Ensifer sp. MPMI2T]|nr:hypothetical protein EHS39_04275 [Ensifer sp. MPMI2T]